MAQSNTIQKYVKILSIISFSFISLVLIILILSSPADGYELSIYQAYPLYFWFFIVGAVILSISSLFIYSIYEIKGNSWLCGLLPLIFVYFIFLLLPIFRGYALYGRGGADVLTHIGHMKTIVTTGHLFDENIYPITHILHVTLKFIGIPFEKAVTFVPSFFSIIYLFFILLLAKIISKNFHHAIFVLAFSSPLLFSFFHTCIHPFIICLYVVPLLIYSFHKREDMKSKAEFSFIIVLLSILIVFFHPLMTLILVMILVMFGFSEIIFKLIVKSDVNTNFKKNINVILIVILSFLAWYLSFHLIQNLFEKILIQFRESIAISYTKTLDTAQISIFQIINLIIYKYGAISVYILIALICAAIVFKKSFSKKSILLEFLYGAQVILGASLGGIFLLSYLIVADPIRAFIYAILISAVFAGLILYKKIKKIKMSSLRKPVKIFIICFVILIVLGSSVLCILNVYPSPITSSTNPQMSHMEKNGLEFFLLNKAPEIPTASFGFSFKINDYIFGIDKALKTRYGNTFSLELPSRFGYMGNESLQAIFNYNKTYIIITEFNRVGYKVLPRNTWAIAHRYMEEDFERLNRDFSVDKIFDNNEFETMLISND